MSIDREGLDQELREEAAEYATPNICIGPVCVSCSSRYAYFKKYRHQMIDDNFCPNCGRGLNQQGGLN